MDRVGEYAVALIVIGYRGEGGYRIGSGSYSCDLGEDLCKKSSEGFDLRGSFFAYDASEIDKLVDIFIRDEVDQVGAVERVYAEKLELAVLGEFVGVERVGVEFREYFVERYRRVDRAAVLNDVGYLLGESVRMLIDVGAVAGDDYLETEFQINVRAGRFKR